MPTNQTQPFLFFAFSFSTKNEIKTDFESFTISIICFVFYSSFRYYPQKNPFVLLNWKEYCFLLSNWFSFKLLSLLLLLLVSLSFIEWLWWPQVLIFNTFYVFDNAIHNFQYFFENQITTSYEIEGVYVKAMRNSEIYAITCYV